METAAEVQETKSLRRGSKRPDHTGIIRAPGPFRGDRAWMDAMRALSNNEKNRGKSFRAAITNNPLKLVKRNINYSRDERRWRDLWFYYAEKLNGRIDEESVRVRVLALINTSLALERLTAGLVAGRGGKLVQKSNYDRNGHPHTLIYERGDPHLLIHLTGIITSLLKSLGLDKDASKDDSDNGKQSDKKEQEKQA